MTNPIERAVTNPIERAVTNPIERAVTNPIERAVTNPIERLVAHEEIRQLVARYAMATDRRDIDTLVSLFVSDVRVGSGLVGREALAANLTMQLKAIGVSILNVGTHQIDLIDDNEARGHVYCKAEVQDGDRWIHQAIRYDDRYSRRDGKWLFVGRRHLLFYGAEVGQNPLSLGPADWPEHHEGLGTLPFSDPSWQQFWAE